MAPDAGAPLAGFLLRKHTLSRIWLGELKYDDARVNEVDPPIAAAAVTTYGGVVTAGGKRRAQTGAYMKYVVTGVSHGIKACEQAPTVIFFASARIQQREHLRVNISEGSHLKSSMMMMMTMMMMTIPSQLTQFPEILPVVTQDRQKRK